MPDDARSSRICSRCGTTAACAPGGLPSGWSLDTSDARVQYQCADCVRANLRAIEGKLPQDYWEW